MNFNDLIHPFHINNFLEHYWEKTFLHIERDDIQYYSNILSVSDIDQYVLGNQNLALTPFKMYRGAEEAKATDWCAQQSFNDVASNVVDSNKIFDLFQQGYGLYVNFPEKIIPNIRHFCAQIEKTLRVKALSHLIISPPNAQGFLPHTDPYGVFVMQIAGSKTWSLYHVPEYPPPAMGVNYHQYVHAMPELTLELKAGNLLYIPRGMIHAVVTGHAYSVHLSLGLMPPKGTDLVELLAAVVEQYDFFREYVPCSFGASERELTLYQDVFKQNLIDMVQKTDFIELLHQQFQSYQSHDHGPKRLTELISINQLQIDSVLAFKHGSQYQVWSQEENGECYFAFEGKVLSFPICWKEGLEGLLSKASFAVNEIGQDLLLEAQERIQVAKNLMHAGFLQFASDST